MARWRPGRLSGMDTRTLTWTLVVTGTWRALDYASGVDRLTPGLSVVEAAAPLWVWSIAMVVGTALLVVGMLTSTHVAVWLGYVWLALTYLGLLTGVLTALASWSLLVLVAGTAVVLVLVARCVRARRRWPLVLAGLAVLAAVVTAAAVDPLRDGLRGAGPLVVVLVVHALLALRTGVHPVRDDHAAQPVEVTLTGAGESAEG